MWFYLICIFLLLAYVLLIALYSKLYNKVAVYKPNTSQYSTYITVLIPARNEAANIITCLRSIANQQYPAHLLEVIIIDDQSTDNTAQLVTSHFPQYKLLQMPSNTVGSKKQALDLGIKAAQGTLIVCTDADCTAENQWLATIAAYYQATKAAFIACPVKLTTLLNKWNAVQLFQTIDFITLQGITIGAVENGLHMMSNGANLAFTKAAFQAVNGYSGIDQIATGDDMLLMQKIKDKYPSDVHYLKSQKAIVTSQTVATWKQFFIQRIRWSSKASHYTDKKLYYALVLVYFINCASVALLLSLIWWPSQWLWCMIYFIVKAAVEYRFFRKISKYFSQTFLNKWFFVFIPVHMLYIVIAGWFGKFGKVSWKGRVS